MTITGAKPSTSHDPKHRSREVTDGPERSVDGRVRLGKEGDVVDDGESCEILGRPCAAATCGDGNCIGRGERDCSHLDTACATGVCDAARSD